MSTATVHRLPSAAPTLDEQVAALQPGQWVRVTWHNKDNGARGTVEGHLTRPFQLSRTLFVGPSQGVGFCLVLCGSLHPDVTKVETTRPDDLDMDRLWALAEEWNACMAAVDDAPVGRFKTGDNTAEQNAAYEAERELRAYLRGVRI